VTDLDELERLEREATAGPWFGAYAAIHSLPLTHAHRDAEEKLTDASPDSEWEALPDARLAFVPVIAGDTPTAQGASDACLIVALRNAAPALLAELRQLRSRVAGLLDQNQATQMADPKAETCRNCKNPREAHREEDGGLLTCWTSTAFEPGPTHAELAEQVLVLREALGRILRCTDDHEAERVARLALAATETEGK
jgi:hypothetical protein